MYTIAKSKGSNKYVVYLAGETKIIPVCNPMDKKKALHLAAECSGMDYDSYMKWYRKEGQRCG